MSNNNTNKIDEIQNFTFEINNFHISLDNMCLTLLWIKLELYEFGGKWLFEFFTGVVHRNTCLLHDVLNCRESETENASHIFIFFQLGLMLGSTFLWNWRWISKFGLVSMNFIIWIIGSGFLSLILHCSGKFGVSIAFSVVYIITSEMFPTPLRHSTMGLCSMIGRLGSMISPQISLMVSMSTESFFVFRILFVEYSLAAFAKRYIRIYSWFRRSVVFFLTGNHWCHSSRHFRRSWSNWKNEYFWQWKEWFWKFLMN